ncbi:hypothetical protein GPJ56_000937 [Histomonas meleagridis]|uniref:uncharacterized protein n=1 Tax=Histomonas meleagridis TaxID=135588 RepID=UPI00355AB77E|nr:hypothetical protein GPJ56_000937 [Histomonas meleagridis]KAH0803772.1 hypothetical protein GO595_002602 [Histomonas meleagridis]
MIASLQNDFRSMKQLLQEICDLSDKVGGFDDGPDLRDQIQSKVQTLKRLSSQSKQSLMALSQKNDPAVNECQKQFDELNQDIQQKLVPVLNKLRSSTAAEESAPAPQFQNQLVSQAQVDQDTEYLEILEQEVNSILQTMKDVNKIFHETLEELQKQRHVLVGIDTTTTQAAQKMETGNKELKEAHEHQKKCTIY